MTQPIRLQGRIPLLALIVVALATLASITVARVTAGAATQTEAATPAVVATELMSAERPVVQTPADTTGCGSGTYVTGDLAGDASPAEIYATMCGQRQAS
jgi:hypothetical protein